MRNYCPRCRMWLPDGLKECPICREKGQKKRTTIEIIFYAVLGVAIAVLVLSVAFPGHMYSYIQAIEVEFVEITNGSQALMEKLGLDNDTLALQEWQRNVSQIISDHVNSTLVSRIAASRVGDSLDYLRKIDVLANYVAASIAYREKRTYVNITDIMYRFSGDDRSHVILLASLFNQSGVDFRLDIVEDGTKGSRGYHYRMLVLVTSSEEEVRKNIVNRIRKRRSGMGATKVKVWYVKDGDFRWYVIDTTGETKKRKSGLADTSWTHIGSSHPYYANRSHYSFSLPLNSGGP